MSLFARKDLVYMSSFHGPGLATAERALIPVMSELVRLGAHVHLIVPHDSDLVEPARAVGVKVAPYRFAKKNVWRTASRMRKYLRRHDPVVAHAVGFTASILLRLAARPLSVGVVDTVVAEDWPPGGRNRGSRRVWRSSSMRTAAMTDAVIVDSADLRSALAEVGYDPSMIVVMPELGTIGLPEPASGDDGPDPTDVVVREHLVLYERLARRWQGPAPVRGPKRRNTVRRVRRDARKAVRREG
jgi:hypothetical protein